MLAFLTRLRPPEELYICTLYALFIPTEKRTSPRVIGRDAE